MKLRNILIVTLVIFSCNNQHLYSADTDSTIIVENSKIFVEIEKRGGQFIDIHLKTNPVNPLTWKLEVDQMPKHAHENAQYKGHFLCMGNIGKPSKEEINAGVVMRGEQTGKIWSVERENDQKLLMESSSPTDGLEVSRILEIHESESQFLVVESFKNNTANGRATNVLQHVTIGPPFLNENTLINTNARSGFYFKYEYPDPHKYEYDFPFAVMDTISNETVDLRSVSVTLNYLSRHIVAQDNDFGWVTAYDPVSGVLLGYVWQADQYPWLNFWNASKDNMPTAKGLEFGTTGIGGTFDQLLEDSIPFHRQYSWEYIDAGETSEKSFLVFIADIGNNQNNPSLEFSEDSILIIGDNDTVHGSISNTLKKKEIVSNNRKPTGKELACSIYPNPANDKIAIKGVGNGSYVIYDMIGNKLLEGELMSPINTSGLKSGMYLLSVNGQVMRFIKSQ